MVVITGTPNKLLGFDENGDAIEVDGVGGGDIHVASRAALAAIAATAGMVRFLAETGREGLFRFDGANLTAKVGVDPAQGVHVAPVSDTTGASGAWVRVFTGPVSVKWFGAVGDDTANDGAAFTAAIAYAEAVAQTGYGYPFGIGAPTLFIPAGRYFLSTTSLELQSNIIFRGEGGGIGGGGIATLLRWAADTTGIRVQTHNTAGASGGAATQHSRGDGAIIEHLGLYGGYTSAEGEHHGIQLRGRATIRHCSIDNFPGDGIHVTATAGGTIEGNANLFLIDKTFFIRNRNGLYLDGADANAGLVMGCDFSNNRRWGVWDSSFLGNCYVGCHFDSNGLIAGTTPTQVSHNGSRYYVKVGQASGAATNAPSGTTADNIWWGYIGAGGPSESNNIPAWVSGIVVREGGPYHTDDSNAQSVFVGCYTESGQNVAQVEYNTLTLGHQFAGIAGGAYIRGGSGHVTRIKSPYAEGAAAFDDNVTIAGILTANGGGHNIRNESGSNVVTFRNAGTSNQLQFNTGSTVDGLLAFLNGTRTQFHGYPAIRFIVGSDAAPVTVADIESDGINLAPGKVLKYAGVPVTGCGPQQPAIAEPTAGTNQDTEARATIGSILSALRTHGLIAA
jgi:hypothetical protein